METNQILLSRFHFGATASFHIIFPCLIIGLALYLTVLEALWLKTKREFYRIHYRFWLKPFAATFIIGVVSGVVLAYQLDTVFSDFYRTTINVLVPIRKVEFINVMLLEGGCFAVMVWGWRLVGDRLHFLATVLFTTGVIISAVCILARNSWMQTPAGFLLSDGRLLLEDSFSAIFNPSFPYRFLHMLGAAAVSTAFFILGISAWLLLQNRHRLFAQFSLRVSLGVISVLIPLQLLSGHWHGLNTQHYQPAKLAAIEALWDTTPGAPLVLFAIPDQELERNRYAVEIPKLASVILAHDPNAEIRGLKEFPKAERPNVPVVFFGFRLMVGMGLMMLAVAITGLILRRQQRLYKSRWFLKICCAMLPSGFIATIAGWCVAEAGRQPWVVYGLIKTAEITRSIPASQVMQSLTTIGIAYSVMFVLFISFLWIVIKRGPDEIENYGSSPRTAPNPPRRHPGSWIHSNS